MFPKLMMARFMKLRMGVNQYLLSYIQATSKLHYSNYPINSKLFPLRSPNKYFMFISLLLLTVFPYNILWNSLTLINHLKIWSLPLFHYFPVNCLQITFLSPKLHFISFLVIFLLILILYIPGYRPATSQLFFYYLPARFSYNS